MDHNVLKYLAIKLLIEFSIEEPVELNDIPVFEPLDDDDAPPIDDFPPPYTSVDVATRSHGQ